MKNQGLHLAQQIAEYERLSTSRTRLSWALGSCSIISMIAVPLLCGLADFSTGAIYAISLLSIFGFGTLSIIFQSIAKGHQQEANNLRARRQHLNVQENIAPMADEICFHYSGLPIAANATCQFTMFQDMAYIHSGSMEFKLPTERIVSINMATQTQVEYIQKQVSFSRVLLSGLLFGDLGALIAISSAEKDKKVETTEKFLVLSYETEDKDTIKCISLKMAKPEKVIALVNQYAPIQSRSFKL